MSEIENIEIGKWYRVYGNPIYHSLRSGEPVQVVEDLSNDERFKDDLYGRKTYKVRTVFGKEHIMVDWLLYEEE